MNHTSGSFQLLFSTLIDCRGHFHHAQLSKCRKSSTMHAYSAMHVYSAGKSIAIAWTLDKGGTLGPNRENGAKMGSQPWSNFGIFGLLSISQVSRDFKSPHMSNQNLPPSWEKRPLFGHIFFLLNLRHFESEDYKKSLLTHNFLSFPYFLMI